MKLFICQYCSLSDSELNGIIVGMIRKHDKNRKIYQVKLISNNVPAFDLCAGSTY